MPVIKSNRPYAKMLKVTEHRLDTGINRFIIDRVKITKISVSLKQILNVPLKDIRQTGIFQMKELYENKKQKKPIATMQDSYVVHMMDAKIRGLYCTYGAYSHILIPKNGIILPRTRGLDVKLRLFKFKYPHQMVASILFQYGKFGQSFVANIQSRTEEGIGGNITRCYADLYPKSEKETVPKFFRTPRFEWGCRFITN